VSRKQKTITSSLIIHLKTAILILIVSFFAISASGELIVGPVGGPGDSNLPLSYQDGNGLTLEQCVDPAVQCGTVEVPAIRPPGLSDPLDYWVAEARMQTYGGKGGNPDIFRPGGQATATLTMQLSRAYVLDVNGDPIISNDNRYVMQSLQFRIDSLRDGFAYKITTPFGVFDNIVATADFDGPGGVRIRNVDTIKETFQFPDFAEPAVTGSALTDAARFDQSGFGAAGGTYSATPYSATNPFPGMDRFLTCVTDPGTGFLGPLVVILTVPTLVECTIEGSPLGAAFNIFRIEGSQVGGGPELWDDLSREETPGSGPKFTCGINLITGLEECLDRPTTSVNMIETNQFRIIGKVSSTVVPTLQPPFIVLYAVLLLATVFWTLRRRRVADGS